MLKNSANNAWARRQTHLREWRNDIWEGAGKPEDKATYLNWHWDFFRNFYQRPSTDDTDTLDVGCGYMLKNFEQDGQLGALFEYMGTRYCGIDPLDDWFGLVEDHNIELHQGVGEQLPFGDNQFDQVFCLAVLDHVMKPKVVLREIYRVLKPGGYLWFANTFVEGTRWTVMWEYLLHRLGFDPDHLFVWTPAHLDRLIENAGFEIIQAQRSSVTASHFFLGEKKVGHNQ